MNILNRSYRGTRVPGEVLVVTEFQGCCVKLIWEWLCPIPESHGAYDLLFLSKSYSLSYFLLTICPPNNNIMACFKRRKQDFLKRGFQEQQATCMWSVLAWVSYKWYRKTFLLRGTHMWPSLPCKGLTNEFLKTRHLNMWKDKHFFPVFGFLPVKAKSVTPRR